MVTKFGKSEHFVGNTMPDSKKSGATIVTQKLHSEPDKLMSDSALNEQKMGFNIKAKVITKHKGYDTTQQFSLASQNQKNTSQANHPSTNPMPSNQEHPTSTNLDTNHNLLQSSNQRL